MMPQKTKSDNRIVDIKMDDKLYIQTYIIISGIQLNSHLLKNDYGTNQLFKYLVKGNLGIFSN